jgi:O-methyltransferase
MLKSRYLNLMEDVLIGAFIEDAPIPTEGYKSLVSHVLSAISGKTSKEAPPASALGYNQNLRDLGWDWPSKAFTMVGRKRLRNFRDLIERTIEDGVPGDIIETGVWRGGASIMARAVLMAHDIRDRKVIVADSFAGLPPPATDQYPADHDSKLHEFPELAISLEQVQENFQKFDLLDDQVVFLKGWFRDTMPTVTSERFSVLRLDGDMYESTIDPLLHLYDRLSVGGWVIVDDYGFVPASKQATHDFLDSRGLSPEIHPIDGAGVYFQKDQ